MKDERNRGPSRNPYTAAIARQAPCFYIPSLPLTHYPPSLASQDSSSDIDITRKWGLFLYCPKLQSNQQVPSIQGTFTILTRIYCHAFSHNETIYSTLNTRGPLLFDAFFFLWPLSNAVALWWSRPKLSRSLTL